MAYLSYDHSEIIVVKKAYSYSEGLEYVFSLHEKLPVFKVHTIFSVKEDILCSYENISNIVANEMINCRLHCVVKDFEKARTFYETLLQKLKTRGDNRLACSRYDTVGNQDWLVEINHVSIWNMLEHYKTGNILTHSNPDFAEAFFNIETEILIDGEEKYGKLDSR